MFLCSSVIIGGIRTTAIAWFKYNWNFFIERNSFTKKIIIIYSFFVELLLFQHNARWGANAHIHQAATVQKYFKRDQIKKKIEEGRKKEK